MRLGVIGHQGYEELPEILRTLFRVSSSLGIDPQLEQGLHEVAGKGARLEDPSQIDALITSSRFWNEPAYTPPCPDFGASNLLLKVRGRPESVRNGLCSSAAADLVQAALGA